MRLDRTAPDDDWGGIHRHRAPRPGMRAVLSSLGARLGVGVLVFAALALGGAISAHRPDTDTRERPFVRTGAAGALVSARTFAVTVLGVRGAATVNRSGTTHDTGGVWVLVKVRAVAGTEPVAIGYAAVRDVAGHEYRATERFSQPLVGGRDLQPGLPVVAEVVFEVPRAVAGDLAVRFAKSSLDRRMDAVAEIALPHADRSTVDGWATAPAPVVVADPEVAL